MALEKDQIVCIIIVDGVMGSIDRGEGKAARYPFTICSYRFSRPHVHEMVSPLSLYRPGLKVSRRSVIHLLSVCYPKFPPIEIYYSSEDMARRRLPPSPPSCP